MKTVLILGANSDVAKETMLLYVERGYRVFAASRNLRALQEFIASRELPAERVTLCPFDATAFDTHRVFYFSLPVKPHIVLYAAGFQVTNDEALVDWDGTRRMIETHYAGAVSILNLVVMDKDNDHLERIIGLSSLSGVRGRKSNFVYGSTKAAFTTYLAGLRQYLSPRRVVVNAVISGYIRSKMTAHLDLPSSLLMEPSFIARKLVKARKSFLIVPGFKWKIIYRVLRVLPERLVSRLP
jgi:short-subunit dehydrogenase